MPNIKSVLYIVFVFFSLTLSGQMKKVAYDEDGNVKDSSLHLFFPRSIEKMSIVTLYKYPHKELGYSIGYNGKNGFKATVYVYDNNLKNIPNGYDSKVVKESLNLVSKSLQIMQKRGTYKDVKITGMGMFRPEKSRITFLKSDYSYIERRSGGTETNTLESHCFITGFAENFIKIRFTYPKEHMVEGEKKVERFISEIAEQLEKSEKAFKKEGLGFTIYASFFEEDETTAAVWLAYIVTRQQYIKENPKKYLEVPGIIPAQFAEELDARTGMVTVWKDIRGNKNTSKNKYFDDLLKVKDAGFMKEYVWTFLKRESWEKPEDLKLNQFEKWSKKNIPEHKVETKGELGFSREIEKKKK